MKRKRIHTATEKAEVLARTTLRLKDICVLFDCGYKRANALKYEFIIWFHSEHGYDYYGGKIPTTEFLRFTKYDEKRIERYARLGY